MGFLDFLADYKWVILFYLLIILFVFIYRKKFVFQAKIIALYRTKLGLKIIDKVGTNCSEFVKIIGYIGLGVSYLGMLVILYFIFKGAYDMIFVPGAPAVIAPVLPGLPIMGTNLVVPFWQGIISLFIVVLVHEFSHGIVARAHKLPVLSSGIVFFGPLIGAFVEPDENKIKKSSDVVQYSVFAAGPWSNIILWLIVSLIVSLCFVHVSGTGWDEFYPNNMIVENGITFDTVVNNTPAQIAGLKTGVVYNQMNDFNFTSAETFSSIFLRTRPNETITLTDADGNVYSVMTGEHKDYNYLGKYGVGYLGISGIKTSFTLKKDTAAYRNKFNILGWLGKLLFWLQALSLGLGLANLLPIGPLDGGRMLLVSLQKTAGEKRGQIIWSKITLIMVIIIGILLFNLFFNTLF
jgi:membrane-associated protease RseP (regulator of RpoE activity)